MIKVIKSAEELQRLRSLLKEAQLLPHSMKPTEYSDDRLHEFAWNAAFLECNMVRIAELGEYSCLDILYSRYHWFAGFVAHYESVFPKDEGLRQQLFQIIETIDIEAAETGGEINIDLLENIEKELNFSSID